MRRMTVTEFHAALTAQGVSAREHLALICPLCGVVQSAQDLIDAGAGGDFDSVEPMLGFSCVGRWTGAPAPREGADGQPCNWTLGGLFRLHQLEILTDDGKAHPRFLPASPEQAQQHEAARVAA
ncbi:VVA0879 family protein [uncultured Brevundimonas sp.]|uniref:VVA0879 family protein n=1 Tax=uncultured Brevundimonas sp. TaxID=213418 RepID=UPI0025FAB4AE|nr:VVA0879 family protein [uncultured Brevundimonas sp.]